MGVWSEIRHPRGARGLFARSQSPKLDMGRLGRARARYAADAADLRTSHAYAAENVARAELEHARRWGVRVAEHEQKLKRAQALSRAATAGYQRMSARARMKLGR